MARSPSSFDFRLIAPTRSVCNGIWLAFGASLADASVSCSALSFLMRSRLDFMISARLFSFFQPHALFDVRRQDLFQIHSGPRQEGLDRLDRQIHRLGDILVAHPFELGEQ